MTVMVNFNEEKKACRTCIHCKDPRKPKRLYCIIRNKSVKPGDKCRSWQSIIGYKIINKGW